jgi:hypothetical protein
MRDRNGFVVEVECIFFPASSSMHALLDIYVPFFFPACSTCTCDNPVWMLPASCMFRAFGACSARHIMLRWTGFLSPFYDFF